jgi:hypothetical protein
MIRKLDKAASERGFECNGLLTTVDQEREKFLRIDE